MKLYPILESYKPSNTLKLRLLNFVDDLEAKLPTGSLVGELLMKIMLHQHRTIPTLTYYLPILHPAHDQVYICEILADCESGHGNDEIVLNIYIPSSTFFNHSRSTYKEAYEAIIKMQHEEIARVCKTGNRLWRYDESEDGLLVAFDQAVAELCSDNHL